MKARRVRAALLMTAALLLSACYDRKEMGTLNPDGSGKMVVVTELAVATVVEPGKPKVDVLVVGRQVAAEFILKTRGVDAWSDVSVEAVPGNEGRVRITGTAYFPDVSKLAFDLPIVATWKKQANGEYLFTIERPRAPATSTAPATGPAVDSDEIKKMVAEAQAEYKEQQLLVQSQLSAFHQTITYTLPGTVKDSRLLTVKDPHTVTVELDGKKIGPVLDKFMADDKALAASLVSGRNATDNDDYLLEALYGKKGPATATVTDVPEGAVFDYMNEMVNARLHQEAMLKDAGVEMPRLTIRVPATTQGK